MSRPRSKRYRHLPAHVRLNDGSYYFVDRQEKWHRLCRESAGAAAMYEALVKFKAVASGGSMPAAIAAFRRDYIEGEGLALTTKIEYNRVFDVIAQDFVEFTVPQVKAPHIDAFLTNHFSAGAGKRARPAMKRHAKARLSTFFRWCVRKGLRDDNPCAAVWVKNPPKHKSKWTDETFHKIRDALLPTQDQSKWYRANGELRADVRSGLVLQCYLDLSFLLYQRATDVRLLRQSQIKEHAGLIHFEPSKTAKTSGKDVDIPITREVAAVLARARKLAKIDPTLGGDAYIIQTSSGRPYTASGIRGAIGFAAERAGLAPPRHAGQQKPRASGFTAKDLRAYASSSANQQGYSFEKLKTALAHARIATTEGYVQQHTTPVSEVVMRLPNRPF